jgi:hypothetical protein
MSPPLSLNAIFKFPGIGVGPKILFQPIDFKRK